MCKTSIENAMSHISGNYNYKYIRIQPEWSNSNQTGISSLVLGLSCSFDGVDSYGNALTVSRYIDGREIFSQPISENYLTNNIDDICNSYAHSKDWFNILKLRVSGAVNHKSLTFDLDLSPVPDA